MEVGLGPGVLAAVGELSQEEAGELSLQSLVVGGARRFLVDIWGLAESLVPAYTNSSIFCEKLRSGDAGERDSVSGERGSSSGVSGDVLSLSRCTGEPGTRRRGTAVKHFIWKHRDRWRTGTHSKMTLRLDTEAGKHRALKGETKLGN